MDETYRRFLTQGELAGARYALVSPRRAPSGLTGSQLGRRAGSSMDFMEHREYQPGDDLRHLDWSAYARTDRMIVKLYREEVTPHLDVMLDTSKSMSLEGSAKAEAAIGLAAAISSAAENSSFSHALWLAGEGVRKAMNGGERAPLWEDVALDTAGSPQDAIAQGPPAWRGHGVRVFISDLLWMGDPMHVLHALANNAASLHVIQVLAASDAEAPAPGNHRLVDSETGVARDIFIDASAQQRYADGLARHQQLWDGACRQVGATLTTLIAEKLVDGWDLRELVNVELLKVP